MTKILLVEDDKSLREIYGVRLLAEGYDIVSAGDGEEALAMAIKERPHLIVSDVMMPKISGFDMLDILRSTTETRDIKVIMMTALSSEDQRSRGEQLGADRYLVKSQVGIEDVVRTVHEVLGDAPTGNVDDSKIFTTPAPLPTSSPAPAPSAQPATPQPQMQRPPQPAQQPGSYRPANPSTSPLPQPTAPFSSPRPANLGDRIIHPISQEDQNRRSDVAALMDQELQRASQPSTPQPAQFQQQQSPQTPAPQAEQSGDQIAPPPPPPAPSPEFVSPDDVPRGAVAFTPQPHPSSPPQPQQPSDQQ